MDYEEPPFSPDFFEYTPDDNESDHGVGEPPEFRRNFDLRKPHPGIEWSAVKSLNLHAWVRKANEVAPQWNRRISEEDDGEGNTRTRLQFFSNDAKSPVSRATYNLFENPKSGVIAISRGESNSYNLVTGAVNYQATEFREDGKIPIRGKFDIHEIFNRNQNLGQFIQDPDSLFAKEQPKGRAPGVFRYSRDELTPNVLAGFSGSYQFPSSGPAGEPIPTEMKMKALQQIRQTTGNPLYANRDSFIFDTEKYFKAASVPFQGQYYDSPKDERRFHRGTNYVLTGHNKPQEMRKESAFFSGGEIQYGYEETHILVDNAGLFSEGGGLTLAGRKQNAKPREFRINNIGEDLTRDQVNQLGFIPGTIYGKKPEGQLEEGLTYGGERKRVGNYQLNNASWSGVIGVQQRGKNWFATMLEQQPYSHSENKGNPGMKTELQGITSDNPLAFLAPYNTEFDVIRTMPSKPARVMQDSTRSLFALSPHKVMARIQRAANDMGVDDIWSGTQIWHDGKILSKFGEQYTGNIPDDATLEFAETDEMSTLVNQAAVQHYVDNTRSPKFKPPIEMSTWYLKTVRDALVERYGQEEGAQKYATAFGNPDLSGTKATLTDYSLNRTVIKTLTNPLSKGTSGKANLNTENLNILAYQQPEAFKYLTEMDSQSDAFNPDRAIIRAHLSNAGTNVNMDTVKLSKADLFEHKVYAGLMSQGIDQEFDRHFLASLADTYRGRYIETDAGIIPPADTLLRKYRPAEEDEKAIGNMAAKALLGEGDMAEVVKAINEHVNLPNVRKRGFGLSIPAFTGAVQASPDLPPGYSVVDEDTMQAYAKDIGWRKHQVERAMNLYKQGELSGVFMMSSGDERMNHQPVRIISPKMAVDMFGGTKGYTAGEGQPIVSQMQISSMSKDADGDPGKVVPIPLPAEKMDWRVIKDIFTGRGDEAPQLVEKIGKAGQAFSAFMKNGAVDVRDAMKKFYKPIESIVAGFEEATASKAEMAMSHAPYIETLGIFAREMAQRTGMDVDKVQRYTGNFGFQPYQRAMDLKYSKDPSTQYLQKYYYEFGIDSGIGPKDVGGVSTFMGGQGEEAIWGSGIGLGDKAKLAQRLFSRVMGIEMAGTGNAEDDKKSYGDSPLREGYVNFAAPALMRFRESTNQDRVSQVKNALMGVYDDVAGKREASPESVIKVLSAIMDKTYGEEETKRFSSLSGEASLTGYKGSTQYRRGMNTPMDDLMSLMLGVGAGEGKEAIGNMSLVGSYMLGVGVDNSIDKSQGHWKAKGGGLKRELSSALQKFATVNEPTAAALVRPIVEQVRHTVSSRKGNKSLLDAVNRKVSLNMVQGHQHIVDRLLNAPAGRELPEEELSIEDLRGQLLDLNDSVIRPPKYMSGGYTGPGHKNEVAGIVHADEYVIKQEDVSRIEGGDGANVLREIQLDLMSNGNVVREGVGYRTGGKAQGANSYSEWSDQDRSMLRYAFTKEFGADAVVHHGDAQDFANRASVGWERSSDAIMTELRKANLVQRYDRALPFEEVDLDALRAAALGQQAAPGSVTALPMSPAMQASRSAAQAAHAANKRPVNRSAGGVIPTPGNQGLTQNAGAPNHLYGLNGYTPDTMHLQFPTNNGGTLGFDAPYDFNVADEYLTKFISSLTAGKSEGAEMALRDLDTNDLTGIIQKLDSFMSDLSPEDRISMPQREVKGVQGLLGKLEAIDKGINLRAKAFEGDQIPTNISKAKQSIGDTLGRAEVLGFSGLSQAQVEDEARKDVEKRRDRVATQRSGGEDAFRFEAISTFIEKMRDIQEVTTHVNAGHEVYIKHAREMVKLFDDQAQNLAKADSNLKDVGDYKLLPDADKAILDRAAKKDSAGVTLRDKMAQSTPAMEKLSGSIAQYDVKRRTELFDSEEERQIKLTSLLLKGGRQGELVREDSDPAVWEGGLDVGLPIPIKNKALLEGLGAGARFSERLSGAMWSATHINWNVIQPMAGLVDTYQSAEGNRQRVLAQTGGMSYQDLMQGQYGSFMRRQVNSQLFQEEAGRQIYNSYGGMMEGSGGTGMGRTVGAIASIGGPALAASMLVGSVSGNPFLGAAAGGIVGVGAAANYFAQFTQNSDNSASFLSSLTPDQVRDSQRYSSGGLAGIVSNTANWWASVGRNDPIGALGFGLTALVNPEAAEEGTSLASAQNFARGFWSGGHKSVPRVLMNASMDSQYGSELTDTQMRSADLMGFLGITRSRGVLDEEALKTYSWLDIYGDNMTSQQFSEASDFMIGFSGSGMGSATELTNSLLNATGQSSFSQAAQSNMLLQLRDYMQGIAPEDQLLESMRLSSNAELYQGVNAARMQSGLQPYGITNLGSSAPFADDPTKQAMYNAVDTTFATMWGQSPGLAQAFTQNGQQRGNGSVGAMPFGASMMNRMYNALDAGNFGLANQLSRGFNMSMAYDQQYSMMGFRNVDTYQDYSLLSMDQQRSADAIAQGNRYVATQQLGSMDPRYNLVDLETGASPLRYGVSRSEYGQMQTAAKMMGMSDLLDPYSKDLSEVGIQRELYDIQLGQRQLQYRQSVDQGTLGYQMQMGGALGFDGQGFAVGGDGLAALANVFQRNGVAFNAGNGMGQYQVQDAMTRLQRTQQDYSMGLQTQQLGLSQREFEFAGQAWDAKFGLRQRQFQMSTGYQRNEMNIARGQQVEQQSWQMEDLSYQRDVSEIDFSWNMEDYNRNIRYARGREKRDLMREKGRSVVRFAMQQGQQDRQEDRAETQIEWAADEFERKKDYFEQTTKLQQEEMDLDKRIHDQERLFQAERLNMSRDSHTKEIQWMMEERGLQDQNRLLERQGGEIQYRMSVTMRDAAFAAEMRTMALNNQLTIMNGSMTILSEAFALATQNGAALTDAVNGIGTGTTGYTGYTGSAQIAGVANAPNLAQLPANIAGSLNSLYNSYNAAGNNATRPAQGAYADGGYTGDGGKYEAAGQVHRGEWVVPQSGALVVRGESSDRRQMDEMMVELMRENNRLLAAISANPTLYQTYVNGKLAETIPLSKATRARL